MLPTQTITIDYLLNSIHRVVVEGMLGRRVHSPDRSAAETRNGDRLGRQGQTRGSGPVIPDHALSLKSGYRFLRSDPAVALQGGKGAASAIPPGTHTTRPAIQSLHSTVHIRHRILVAGVEEISSMSHPLRRTFHFSNAKIWKFGLVHDRVGHRRR